MSPRLTQALAELEKLPVEDQEAIATLVLEEIHLGHDSAHPLTREQEAELDRRMAEYDADPSIGIPWEEVKASLAARIRR